MEQSQLFVKARKPLILILAGLILFVSGPVGRLLASGAVVLFAPGYLLWMGTGNNVRLPRLAAPALWLGLSISVIPIVFLWVSTIGLSLTPAVVRGLTVGLVIVAGWNWQHSSSSVRVPWWLATSWVGLLALVGITRWLHIRGLVLPMWVDSLHHTLLSRIAAETGRIPQSLEPYMPVPKLVYHWGYHTVIAVWQVVAAIPIATAVLWCGQVLNALMALAMYGLGAVLLRSPRAGLIAASVTGLLSVFPAYYVSWGRYTQLTGLLVLASLMMVTTLLVDRHDRSWSLIGLNALLAGGLLLIHYQVLAFYATFAFVFTAVALVRRPRKIGETMLRLISSGLLAILAVSPWVWVMLKQVLVPVAATPSALAGSASYNSVDWGLLLPGNSRLLFALAGVGAVWALLFGHWRSIVVALWVAALGFIANPTLIGLPPSWFIVNQTVIIMLFMPVSLLVASCVIQSLRWLEQILPVAYRRAGQGLVGFIAFGIALFGTWQLSGIPLPERLGLNHLQVPIVNRVGELATPADIPAIEWAAANTPPNARFLVNSAYWLNGSPRGTDAGWWLLPLARRWVTTPPAMYVYGKPEYKQSVEELNQRIWALQPTDQVQLEQLVRDERITHVYVGVRGGPIKADLMFGNPLFTPVYDSEGVTIFAVHANP